MIQQLVIQLKLFLKNKVLAGVFSFICFVCFGGILYFIVNEVDSLFLFYIITRFIFYINLLFCVMAFVFMVYAKQNNIEDVLLVSDAQGNIYRKSSSIIIVILFIVINVIILMLLVISSVINKQLNIIGEVISNFYLLNILLPQFVTLLVTFMLSSMKNYYISSLLLLGFLFLTSPYVEGFQWSRSPIIPIDQVINYIQLPFAYFFQNSDWSIDYLYGFQNEFYKVCALIFWSFLSMIFILRKMLVKKKVFLYLSVVISSLLFMAIYIPQSMCRYNNRWDGGFKDLIDYNIMAGENNYEEQVDSDYRITSYNLDVRIKEKLYVTGDIKLESTKLCNEYNLTLYRGYDVKNLSAEHLKSYEQHKDFIKLVFDKPIQNFVINISYSGYHNQLYSNYQAVMLPGYFAWYPMVEEKQVFISAGGLVAGDYGYNPYNRSENAKFLVSIHAQYPILTNLEESSKGVYEGITDSFTILGGQNETKEDGLFQNYYPMNLSNEINYEKLSDLRKESIQIVKDKINIIFDINPQFLQKKIYCGSNGLARNNGFGQYAEFDDYVLLAGDGRINQDSLIKYYIYKSDIHPLLKDIIVSIGIDFSSREEYIKVLQSSIDDVLGQLQDDDEKQRKEYQNLVDEITKNINEKGIKIYLQDLGKAIFD